ncbi:DMT family transporter [Caldisericum sp. AR60]|uniref:DMT family transporter n=1 Tax=Caldisericum sp. AR60 TaxID=3397852 RepID=UPI0039FC8340
MESENRVKLILILIIGVISVGVSSILIRLTDAEPIVIATYRLTLSALIVTPLYIFYSKKISFKDSIVFVPLALFLSTHFVLWIYSLKYTTVASSTVLVTTNPIFVPIFSYIFFRKKVKRELLLGIAIAISGSILIGLSSKGSVAKAPILGDVLALLGAVAVSLYLTFTNRIRQRFELIPFIFFTYSYTAIILIIVSIITRQNLFHYQANTFLMFFLVAFIPQILGHTAYNYSLKYLDPSFIAVTILGEPIIATIGAYFILKETPSVLEIVGAVLILFGIYISARVEV